MKKNKILYFVLSLFSINTFALYNFVGGKYVSSIEANSQTANVVPIDNIKNLKIIPYGIDENDLKTIKAHSRSIAENLKHKLFCDNMGGKDITDLNDIQLTNNTLDVIFCEIVDNKKFINYQYMNNLNFSTHKVKNGKLLEFSINNPIPNGTWQAYAPTGTVSGPYYITGVGVFQDLTGTGYIDVSVPSDRCSALNQHYINGTSKLTATILCGMWSGGQQPSYANACFNNSCVQDRGWITHNFNN